MLEGLDKPSVALIMHWLPLSTRMLLLHTSSELASLAAPAPESATYWRAHQEDPAQAAAASGQLSTAAWAIHAAVSVVVTGDSVYHSRPAAGERLVVQSHSSARATTILFRAYLTVQLAISVHLQALSNLRSGGGARPGKGGELHIPMEATAWQLQLPWTESLLFAVHGTVRLTWLACMGDVSFWQEAICIQQLCSERACCLLLPLRAYLLLLDAVAILARVGAFRPHNALAALLK